MLSENVASFTAISGPIVSLSCCHATTCIHCWNCASTVTVGFLLSLLSSFIFRTKKVWNFFLIVCQLCLQLHGACCWVGFSWTLCRVPHQTWQSSFGGLSCPHTLPLQKLGQKNAPKLNVPQMHCPISWHQPPLHTSHWVDGWVGFPTDSSGTRISFLSTFKAGALSSIIATGAHNPRGCPQQQSHSRNADSNRQSLFWEKEWAKGWTPGSVLHNAFWWCTPELWWHCSLSILTSIFAAPQTKNLERSLTCQQGRPWDCYGPVQETVGTAYTSRVDGRNGRSRTGVTLPDGSTVLQNKDIDYSSTRNISMRNIYLLLTVSWQLKRHLNSSM